MMQGKPKKKASRRDLRVGERNARLASTLRSIRLLSSPLASRHLRHEGMQVESGMNEWKMMKTVQMTSLLKGLSVEPAASRSEGTASRSRRGFGGFSMLREFLAPIGR